MIGGGAGGLTAARAANRRGARTALVHDGPLGGDCTHTGCVPSKTLLDAASRGSNFDEAMAAVRRRIDGVAATEDETALGAEGIEVVAGQARLTGGRGVDVDGRRLQGRHIILATGGRPSVPTVPGLRDRAHLTNETVFDLRTRPQRLAVLGGGAIGVELAQAFRQLGSEVVIIEGESRLLSREEPEASAIVESRLRASGVEVHTGSRLERLEPTETGEHRLHLDAGGAVGRWWPIRSWSRPVESR